MKYYQTFKPRISNVQVIALLFSLVFILLSLSAKAQAPQVVSISPVANETDVEIDKIIHVRFDRAINVDNSSANIYFFDADNSFAILHQFQMTDPEVSVAGLDLRIDPDTFVDWPSGTNIVMRIDSDAIIGWNGILSHPFQIENDARPTLTSTSPSFGATNVSRVSDLTMTFSENISVNPSSFLQIRYDMSGATFESISLSDPSVTVSGNQITITDLTFDFNTDFRVEIGDFLAVTDASGYGFYELHPNSGQNWTFQTNPASPPQVSVLSPADGSTDIPHSGENFTITFNEEIQLSGYFSIRDSGGSLFEEFQFGDLTFGTNSVSFTPQNDFEFGESYYVTYSNIADLEGSTSQSSSNTFWNFTVEAATPPSVISTTPTDDALEVEVDANLQIVYDEPVFIRDDAGTPRIDIFVLNGLAHEVFDLPSPRVTGIGTNTITIDPINDLSDDTKYYVRVLNAFEDANGSDAPNITDPSEWSFDTGSPPQLVSLSPADMSTDVPIGTTLQLTYDEPVFVGTAPSPGITIKRVSDDAFIEYISFNNASQVSGFGTNTVTIQPSSNLEGETEFSITMSANSIMDASGDRPESITGTDWTFTTEVAETTPPTITNFSPANGSTDISTTNWVYTFTFSEPVKAGTGVIFLKKSAVSPFISATVGTSRVSFSGNQVTIDFNADGGANGLMLEENTTYFIEIASGVITDLAGNDFAGLSNPDYTFTTEGPTDSTPPSPASFSPSNNAEEVAVDLWDYSITFNEPIQLTNTPGTSFQLRDASDILITEASTAGVTISGNTLSVDFNHDGELNGDMLDNSTLYHIEIDNGYLEDLAGNDYEGFTANNIWQFETIEAPDNSPPTIVSLTPANGATDVAINANLIIEFNEDIYLDNDAGTFELRRKSPDALVESFDIFGPRITGGNNSETITIDPTSDLEYETEYYFLIGGNDVIIDGGDNAFAGLTTDSEWSFSTGIEPDNTPPAITNFSPANGAADVGNDDPIVLTFSEDVQLTGFGPIRIRRVSNNVNLHEIDPASGQVSIVGNVVTIQPTGGILSLEEEAEVYINWSTTPFEDLAGNHFNGLFSSSDYRFTVNNINPDMTGPSITVLSPADDAIDVAIDISELTVTFDEDVQKFHPGNIIIRNGSGGILHQYFPVSTDNDVVVSGNQVTITLNETLEFGTTYYVQFASNTFEDLAGNEGPVFTDNETWNFTTEAAPDNTAPVVTAFDPLNGANDVATGPVLSATFDEPVFEGIGSGNNIIIREADGTLFEFFQVTDARVTGLGTNTLSLDPNGSFSNGTSYYITFPASMVEDAAGNGISGWLDDQTWSFLVGTVDNTPPQVIGYSPADDALNQATDIDLVLTFDEDVKLGARNVVIKDYLTDAIVATNAAISVSVSGDQVTIDPFTDLANNTHYYIEIAAGSFTDLQDNPYAGISDKDTWDFEVGMLDNQAPQVLTLSPADDATDASLDANLEITFDEPVFEGLGSGNNIIIREADATLFEYFLVTDARVSGLGTNTLTLNPDNNFDPNTSYYVTLPSQIVEDANENGIAGWLDDTSWNFTTGAAPDNTPPSVTAFSPAHQSTDVAIDIGHLQMTFDEDIQKTNPGNIILRDFDNNIIAQYFPAFDDTDVAISGNVLTMTLPGDLAHETSYYIQFISGTIADLAGNNFPGFNNASTWIFTTAPEPDLTAPTITDFSPSNGATGVNNSTSIVFTFDEDVQLTNYTNDFIRFRRVSNDEIIKQINPTSPEVSISGNVVTIQPIGGILSTQEEVELYVNWASTPFEDLAGNDFNDLFSSTDYRFTVDNTPADVTPPSVVSFSPAHQSSDVAIDIGQMQIVFNEDIQKTNPGNIILRDFDNNIIAQYFPTFDDTDASVSGNVLTLNLPGDLTYETSYYVQFLSGTIADLAGNNFPGFNNASTWIFTTEDTPDIDPPVFVSLSPTDDALDVPTAVNLEVTFDENVFSTNHPINVIRIVDFDTDQSVEVFDPDENGNGRVTIAGNVITLNPTNDLLYNHQYYVIFNDDILQDASGNVLPGYNNNFTWNFTTEADLSDVTPPSIVSLSPADNSEGVDPETNLEIAFDENVFLGNSSFLVRYYDNNVNQYTIPYSSENVTVSGNTVTIELPGSLFGETHYWIQINANTITDAAGNGFTGILQTNRDDWDFTTAGKFDQTIIFETIPDKTFGDGPFILNASASSGLPVIFDVVNGSVSIDGNEVTILGTGSASIRARQEGNGEYNAAVAEIRSFNIAKADQTISFSEIADQTFGDTDFDLSASSSSGLDVELSVVSGPVSLVNNTVTINGTGTATIAANQSGNDNYNAAVEVQQTFEIAKANQLITIEAIDDKLVSDASFEVVASVDSDLELSYEVDGPASISGTTITLNGILGTVTVTVSQAGDENYHAASSSITFEVNEKMAQTISFDEIIDKTFGDADFDLTATASSGLEVGFSVVSGPVSITGNTVTISGAGTAIIAANQAGNTTFEAAEEVERSFEIVKADQIISINQIDDKLSTDAPFEVIASVNSGLELTYDISGPATISGIVVTLAGTAGTVTVTVSQAGNDNYHAVSGNVSFEVTEEAALGLEGEFFIQFFPNPVRDFLTVKGENEVEITLISLDGKRLSTAEGHEVRLDMRNLSKGVYVLEIRNKEKVRKEMIIKAN